VTALENATVTFEVSVSHDTVPVKWFHKNVEIKPSDKHRLVSERKVHKLMLQSISPSDAGEYTAMVGQLECKAKLFVESKCLAAPAAASPRGVLGIYYSVFLHPCLKMN
jgi:titin